MALDEPENHQRGLESKGTLVSGDLSLKGALVRGDLSQRGPSSVGTLA